MMTTDLFAQVPSPALPDEALGDGAVLLRGFARDVAPALLAAVDQVTAAAPLRHMITPGGYRMSVAMTNCGPLGWVTSRRGYRYDPIDPETGLSWPPMPDVFRQLAQRAASAAGFAGFEPDACLVNRYVPGAKLSLHQDQDEEDAQSPIVSVSLGIPATFLWGGDKRSDPTRKFAVQHGDVVVWGGPSRFVFHGVAPLRQSEHPALGACRVNLTFRRARLEDGER